MMTTLKYGDHLLAECGITVVAGAERGRDLPEGTALADLRPVTFMKRGDGGQIKVTQVQERALLDEGGSCFAPWGRDLLWRILNNADGEGKTFLATLDKTRSYVFAGDRDLESEGGEVVLLRLHYKGQWDWCYGCATYRHWLFTRDQFLTLGNSPDD